MSEEAVLDKPLLTIKQFTRLVGISMATWCRWRLAGNTPPVVDLGAKTMRIRQEDADEWMRQRMLPTPEVIQRTEQRRSIARHAATSPNHPSNRHDGLRRRRT